MLKICELYVGVLHDVVYMAKCPDVSCNASYIGETARRLCLRASEHSGTDDRSHLTRHAFNDHHQNVSMKDFCILHSGHKNTN